MGITENQLNKKLDQSIINKTTKFYKQVLTSWSLLYNHIPENLEEILNEYIFDNRYIKIDNKVLTYKYIKNCGW